jgi:O-antigen/teichoic acid export membrane protein
MAFQGSVIRLFAFLGSVALARLLAPEDFGILALGLALMILANAVSDGGIGAALIRQVDHPEEEDLRALLGFQLAVATIAALAAVAVGAMFGTQGLVVAVMIASLPISAWRMPGTIMLERELAYRRVLVVELADAAAFYAWAIPTAAVGWGAWSLATGVVVRAAVSTSLMASVSPLGFVIPRLTWRRIVNKLGFGVRFQASWFALVVREQSVNVGTTAIAGLSTLGLFSLATRVLSVPTLLFTSLWRVSFPTMSRLLAGGVEAGALIERGIERVAVGVGAVFVPIVAAAPALIPVIFGEKWESAADVLPWASLGLMISGPISVAATGYLYAVGDASTPLRNSVLNGIAYLVVAFSLLPVIGLTALGLGWMASGFVEAWILGRAVHLRTPARPFRAIALPGVLAVVAAGAGWGLGSTLGANLASGVAAAALAELLYMALLLAVARRSLAETVGSARQVLRASWPRARWA